ncbi:MAG: hypothetical protein WBA42_01360 [Mesorhizobium sp.]
MIIFLIPQIRAAALTVSKAGEVLTINGEAFDFSVVPDGASLPAEAVSCAWLALGSTVDRVAGDLHLTLILPVGPQPGPVTAFPADIINPPDGSIALPVDPAPADPEEA